MLPALTLKFQSQARPLWFPPLSQTHVHCPVIFSLRSSRKEATPESLILSIQARISPPTSNPSTPMCVFFFCLSSFLQCRQGISSISYMFVVQVVQGTGVFVANYLQNITRNLTLGVEALAQKGPGGALDSGMTFVGRYTGNDYVATTNLGLNGTVQASYFHKVCCCFPCSISNQLTSHHAHIAQCRSPNKFHLGQSWSSSPTRHSASPSSLLEASSTSSKPCSGASSTHTERWLQCWKRNLRLGSHLSFLESSTTPAESQGSASDCSSGLEKRIFVQHKQKKKKQCE